MNNKEYLKIASSLLDPKARQITANRGDRHGRSAVFHVFWVLSQPFNSFCAVPKRLFAVGQEPHTLSVWVFLGALGSSHYLVCFQCHFYSFRFGHVWKCEL